MLDGTQLTLEDVNQEYKEFVEKFKPKKTTDDCYTPPNVYNAVLEWVKQEYSIKGEIIRPFWPGGDYERFDYPDGCVVVDNPPFSMITEVCRVYQQNNIKFFLFAPYLTNFSTQSKGITHIIPDVDIMYENGATINTAFLTNLEPWIEIRTATKLRKMVMKADRENRQNIVKQLPKYSYPNEVVTASKIGYLSRYGEEFKVKSEDCVFVRALDSQKAVGKAIFGSGYLLSERAAAEKAAAEKAAAVKWPLSEKEKAIIRMLGKKGGTQF